MSQWLQKAWFNNSKLVWLLAPLSFVFYILSGLRRQLFKWQWIRSKSADIPVIVVGNIGIGGNGKTPLVLALQTQLRNRGLQAAVLSRGYGGSQTEFPYLVKPDDSASLVGDEPSLIAKRLKCDVVIDPIRTRGVEYIQAHTSANVIICDDGLQHYAMQRDLEICVLDKRGLGNGYLLPMGPLREGVWRLATVNAVVHNIGFAVASSQALKIPQIALGQKITQFAMQLQTGTWVNVSSDETITMANFNSYVKASNKEIFAIAGIGEPERFFDTLTQLNIAVSHSKSFADHHPYKSDDLPLNKIVLMTEKDAVKCTKFAHKDCWYLSIDGHLSNEFYDFVAKHVMSKAKLLERCGA